MEIPAGTRPARAADIALETTQAALAKLADGAPISSVVEMALRIARLRGDAENLVWLTLETRTVGDEFAKRRAYEELAPILGAQAMVALHKDAVEAYIVERSENPSDEGGLMMGLSVREIEARIGVIREMGEIPEGLPPRELVQVMDLRSQGILRLGHLQAILARVQARVHEFLTKTEVQLLLGEAASGVFEDTRRYVDVRLQEISADAGSQLLAAFRRRGEGDAEGGSHALTSCRRALKTLADALYPAQSDPVEGADGELHEVGDDKYLNRLLQYVSESATHYVDPDLLTVQFEHLWKRLRAVNDLSSKGVHAAVTRYEVDQCIIQTYLTIGDLLRLTDATA